MKAVPATEAARNLSAVLDRITPATMANGQAVKRLLREHRPDADWAAEIDALRADLPVEERAWTA